MAGQAQTLGAGSLVVGVCCTKAFGVALVVSLLLLLPLGVVLPLGALLSLLPLSARPPLALLHFLLGMSGLAVAIWTPSQIARHSLS
jgi:hypothetical protein